MFRTFAIIAAIVASVGVAHAEDQTQIIVTTVGKSPRMVRAELFRAAYTVCSESTDLLGWQAVDDCTKDSLDDALQQFHNLQRPQVIIPRAVAAR